MLSLTLSLISVLGMILAQLPMVATAPIQIAAAADPCTSPANPIVAENCLPGNPASEWDISGSGSPNLQGFATDISVNRGQTVSFKINNQTGATYRLDIYRLGYYQGNGARKITTINNISSSPQPACLTDSTTGLIDCGNWSITASWAVPSNATSGIYIAKAVSNQNPPATSHIVFIVRDDSSHSDILLQTSDTTWQAYNSWGGNSLYYGGPGTNPPRAYKVSYNRPFNTRDTTPVDWLFHSEYPMLRWLERNGYDLTYFTDVDTARNGSLILNHKVFVASGHDEYWSGLQRSNVEAARAAGVHLAFFTANEVYWRTRWENSIDGSNTAFRTLVSYKETRNNAKIDPSPEWTGTWRDPRSFNPMGPNPENALMGNMYFVDCCTYAIRVPAEDGKMRFWRNTAVATQAPGAVATLADSTLGYEWNTTPDNGFQPAGLINLSTATYDVPQYLLDYGSTTGPGTATHHLTLYRHSSGALVFGAGTIQWSWGLDGTHDGGTSTPDVNMQQATVNLFADMGVQPATLQTGLTAATASTDFTPPVSTIAIPQNNVTVKAGQPLSILGTATDSGGGVVGGVEVSTDSGATWHPATGRVSWRYSYTPTVTGTFQLLTRAVDDSGNLQTPTGITITVTNTVSATCPCSLWPNVFTPAQEALTDGQPIEVGVKFKSDLDGYITGLRFYKGAANTGTHIGHLWDNNGNLLGLATFSGESASGWQTVMFDVPVPVVSNTLYVASYWSQFGYYAFDPDYFVSSLDNPPLHAVADATNAPNGVYLYTGSGGFPNGAYRAANYWVDVIFATSAATDNTPPAVVAASPAPGATGVNVSTQVNATFNKAMNASTITASTFELRGPGNGLINTTVGYNSASRTATLTPTVTLAYSTLYTATVKGGSTGVKDLLGNTLSADYVWTFTTAAAPPPPQCPCTIWGSSATPTNAAVNDGTPIEVGVKFRSDAAGLITGLRFYKGAANTGTHTAHLWSNTGALLATATFSNETASGWQQVNFSTPVAINANTTYVASYFSSGGWFAYDPGYFNVEYDNPPLRALAGGFDGPNGVYLYGGSGFPTSGSNHNYWVDVVLTLSGSTDTTPPTVSSVTPANGATGVSAGTAVSATFSEALAAASVNGSTFVLQDAAGNLVAASVTYDAGSNTAVLTPNAPLALAATYTATVKGGSSGITDAAGNPLAADYSWSFTTVVPQTCPCSIWNGLPANPASDAVSDGVPIEVGVKFRSDQAGLITGVRFYKGAANTGTHVGNLWRSDGTLLASATFTTETSSGWQTVTFAAPVAIAANTTYIASYYSGSGYFAFTGGGLSSSVDNIPLHALASGVDGVNGVYRYGSSGFPTSGSNNNYWVDVVYQPASPLFVQANSPLSNATDVDPQGTLSATFNRAVNAATVNTTNFELRDSGGALVPASVGLNAAANTALLTPTVSLSPMALYTATVKGGASGVLDLNGGAMIADFSWSFRPGARQTCPCSLWNGLPATPTNEAVSDGIPIEVGVKFRSDVAGYITALRFYKGAANTGLHTGHLWDSAGNLLAAIDFTNESSSGWQTAVLSTPVAINANATYIASTYSPSGYYAFDGGYFAVGVDNRPLHAPIAASGAPNGVYLYGGSGFPVDGNNANYWVDVVFQTNQPPVANDQNVSTVVDTPVGFTLTASDPENAPLTYSIVSAPLYGSLSGSPPNLTYTPNAGLYGVDVFTFKANDGQLDSNTAAVTVTINAPVPTISALGPNTAVAGDPALTLIVTGTNFVNGAVVRWNGADRTTTYVSSTRLQASIPATDLASAGTANVTVFNPAPGGGTSNSLSFTIAANLLANGRFELDANNDGRPDSWTSVSQFTRSTVSVHGGTYSGRHFATNNASYTVAQVVTGLSAATYRFDGWVNIPATNDAFSIQLQVVWQTTGGSTVRTDTVRTFSAATGGAWQSFTGSLSRPSNASRAQVRMVISSLNATIYVDDFTFRSVP
jgi:hypothetical protein